MPLTPQPAGLIARTVARHGAVGEALFLGRLYPEQITFGEYLGAIAGYGLSAADLAATFPVDCRLTDVDVCRSLGLTGASLQTLEQAN